MESVVCSEVVSGCDCAWSLLYIPPRGIRGYLLKRGASKFQGVQNALSWHSWHCLLLPPLPLSPFPFPRTGTAITPTSENSQQSIR